MASGEQTPFADSAILKHFADCRWEGVDVMPYKENGTHFKNISRQTLFHGGHDIPVEVRYFEIGSDGHSTLERHEHAHLVTVVRGSGQVFVKDDVLPIGHHDMVHIPPMTWHQFRPAEGETLGFICLVNVERDRPQRPSAEDVETISQVEKVAGFIRV